MHTTSLFLVSSFLAGHLLPSQCTASPTPDSNSSAPPHAWSFSEAPFKPGHCSLHLTISHRKTDPPNDPPFIEYTAYDDAKAVVSQGASGDAWAAVPGFPRAFYAMFNRLSRQPDSASSYVALFRYGNEYFTSGPVGKNADVMDPKMKRKPVECTVGAVANNPDVNTLDRQDMDCWFTC